MITTDGEDAHNVEFKTRTGKLHADLTAGANSYQWFPYYVFFAGL